MQLTVFNQENVYKGVDWENIKVPNSKDIYGCILAECQTVKVYMGVYWENTKH